MTSRPERFRVKALECYVAAQKAKDPDAKEIYLGLICGWRELADRHRVLGGSRTLLL
jgi:hypothetical protein